MIYCLLGPPTPQQQSKIDELKQKHITSPEAQNFDYENISASQTDPASLKKSLVSLPVIAAKRLVLIRDCHQLNTASKELIVEFSASAHEHLLLVLESSELTSQDSFIKKLAGQAKIMETAAGPETNVFDMTRAMARHQTAQALKMLADILSQGAHPLQIMGGVVWFWGKSRETLPKNRFENGLVVLQEADLNIKRSRLPPEQALEVLVVKLCGILK